MLILDKNRLKTVRLLFPLHKEGLSSYLSPILGQYAIKNIEFINEFILNFNKQTNNVFKDTLNNDNVESGGSLYDEILFVPVTLNVYKGGKFNIKISTPPLGFIFSSSFKRRRRIYRRLLNDDFMLMRNYKKLLQMTVFKNVLSPFPVNLIQKYKQIRNALFQRK